LIFSICKKVPKEGEVIKYSSNIKFIIKQATPRYIKKVLIKIDD